MRRFRLFLPLATAAAFLLPACAEVPQTSDSAADGPGEGRPPSARNVGCAPVRCARNVGCAPVRCAQSTPVIAESDELQAESTAPVVVVWDAERRTPLRVRTHVAVAAPTPEAAARAFLGKHHTLFGLRSDGADLVLKSTRQGLAGKYLRFEQVWPLGKQTAPSSQAPQKGPTGQNGGSDSASILPVFEGQVVVLLSGEAGSYVVHNATLAHRSAVAFSPPKVDIGKAAALDAVRQALGNVVEDGAPDIVRGIGGTPPVLAYRVQLSTSDPVGAWEAIVDASSGALLSKRDRIVRAEGSGYVFDPSPVATTGDLTLTDNGNATNPTLDGARFLVTLPNLDGSGFLLGTWVNAHTKNINNRAQSAALTFLFTRAQSGFEETNAYFHLDRAQTRLQTLGITDANAHAQEVIADGQQADNSYFDPAKKTINYGTGGVDDAEDADILLHEYGHAIQNDQVPGFGAGGNEGAMGEGFGDYLATSLNRLLSPQISDPNCVGDWDATSYDNGNPPCLRRTDGTKHFPERAVGEVHDDGEMWASALTSLDTTLGADVMNRLVIESHFSFSTTESFFTASQALLDADVSLFGGVHQDVVRRRMIQQGLCRILSAPAAFSAVVSSVDVSMGNPLTGAVYANLLDDTQSFTLPGAGALRLHFTEIDTELDNACLDGACDNIYLTGADGDLFQILSGKKTNVLSVVIPGDTVHIRLVTDPAVAFKGYHVDRVDVLGDAIGTGGGGTGGTGGTMGSGGIGGVGNAGGMGGAGVGGGGMTGGMGGGTGGTGNGGGIGGAGNGGDAGGTTNPGQGGAGLGANGGGGEGGGGPRDFVLTEPEGCGCRTAPGEPRDGVPFSGWIGLTMVGLAVSRRRTPHARRS